MSETAEIPAETGADAAYGARAPISAHKAFVPLLGGWGAALGGLSVAVIPGTSFLPTLLAALACGGVAYFVATKLRQKAMATTTVGPNIEQATAERLLPIDPGAELGSESLDEPVDQADVEAYERERAEAEAEEAAKFAQPELEAEFEPIAEDEFELSASFELTSDAPSETPEPIAVASAANDEADSEAATEEPQETEAPAPQTAPEFVPGAAIRGLRDIPKDELSLIQMVERFAAALHEHSAVHGENAQPRRDAALASALRALGMFTDDKPDEPQDETLAKADETERELREALAKLQKLSGAA